MKKKSPRLRLIISGMLLYAVFPTAWLIRPFLSDDAPICIFRQLTAKPCLFCGLTRSFANAAHGDFHKAFAYHPLWPLVAAIVFAIATICLIDALWGTNLLIVAKRVWNLPVWVLLVLLVILSLVRLF
jgi:hypothetical protein